MTRKISIRFYGDRVVRVIWDDENCKWWFSVLDIVGVINQETEHSKNRNYWKYLKAKLKKEGNQLVSLTTQLPLISSDDKIYNTDVLDSEGVLMLSKLFPNPRAAKFVDWFTDCETSINGQSRKKAYMLFEGNILESIEVGTTRGLQQIHAYIFGGLYDFAGKIRTVNIAKGNFKFAMVAYLTETLSTIDKMPEDNLEQIIDKYIEMNIAHPFREGNGRSTRIWLDLILKKRLQKCIDWSKIDKYTYLQAMTTSVVDGTSLHALLETALTDKISDREIYMKGIDYSYYYEED